MRKNFWNIVEKGKIDAIRYSNPAAAVEKYEAYLEKYPRDYEAKLMYASTLVTIKEFDFAYEILEATKREINSNDKIAQNKELLDHLNKSALVTEIRYLSYTNQFNKLYILLRKLSKEDMEKFDYTKFYCYSNLGYITEDNSSKLLSYSKKQMNSYDEEMFKEFIKRHLYEYNPDEEAKSDKIFEKGFPIDRVIEEVKKHLDYDKCICNSFYTDQYVFKYDVCGKDEGMFQNYFIVICLHNTNNILTMFPARDCEKLPYVDLNYLNNSYVSERPSQIDKFYRKFKSINQ